MGIAKGKHRVTTGDLSISGLRVVWFWHAAARGEQQLPTYNSINILLDRLPHLWNVAEKSPKFIFKESLKISKILITKIPPQILKIWVKNFTSNFKNLNYENTATNFKNLNNKILWQILKITNLKIIQIKYKFYLKKILLKKKIHWKLWKLKLQKLRSKF